VTFAKVALWDLSKTWKLEKTGMKLTEKFV
jgi:hypothetical protein